MDRISFSRWWIIAVIQVVTATGTLSAQGDGNRLDVLLARPVPVAADISAQEARQEIERLEPYIESQPERARVIQAYLIPYHRAVEEAAAREAAENQPPPRQKPLIFVRIGNSTEMVRADRIERSARLVTAIRPDGRRSVFQLTLIAGEVPWYTEEELDSGQVNLEALAARYTAAATKIPAQAKFLAEESQRFRDLDAKQKAAEAAAAERESSRSAVDDLAATTYDPAAGYSLDDLASLLFRAERVRAIASKQAAEVDGWAQPFRAHFEKLLAGETYADGRWMDRAAYAEYEAAQKLAADQQASLGNLRLELSAVALPARRLIPALAIPFGAALVFAIIGLWMLVRGRGAGRLFGGIIMLAAIGGAGTLAIFLASPPDPFPSTADDDADTAGLAAAIYGNGSDAAGGEIVVSDNAINSVLTRQLKPVGTPGVLDATRTAIAVHLRPSGVTIFEKLLVFDQELVVRTEAGIAVLPAGAVITNNTVFVGDVTLPGPLADWFWQSTEQACDSLLNQSQLLSAYQLTALRENEAILAPRKAAAAR